MWLDELDQAVRALADRIKQHERTLHGNEQATRYALIDPLLATLGWNLADPSEVVAEYPLPEGRRVDYAMLYDGEPYLLVEAKKLGDPLSRATDQVAQYAMVAGVQFVILTNGKRWMGYSLGKIGDKQVFEFNVTAPKVLDLLWLWHGNFKGKTTQPKMHGRSVDVPVSASTTPTPSPEHSTSGVPLSDVKYVAGMDKPHRLIFPNGETKNISNRWWKIQAVTAEWLIDHNHVNRLPVQTERGATLLYKRNTSRDAPPFNSPKEVRGHWIEAQASAKQHFTKAKQLLRLCDVDPTTVYVELKPSM